jgi:hypothetical protein
MAFSNLIALAICGLGISRGLGEGIAKKWRINPMQSRGTQSRGTLCIKRLVQAL